MKCFLVFFVFLFGCGTSTKRTLSPEFEKWAAIKSATLGEPFVYGTYQAGCIAGAQALPFEGPGYFVVNRHKSRNYGHPSMMAYISDLGQKIKQKKYPTMIIGDISAPRGGPFLTGHASHQIGLDVDISLTSATVLPKSDEGWPSPSYVQDRKFLLPNWGKNQIQLVALASQSELVNRIFVAPAIKKYFCENFASAPWLYKLRPWWGHDAHLHVRLNCPASSPDCVSQPPLNPADSQCGEPLNWWYSAEADAEASKGEAPYEPRAFPSLPAKCESIKSAN